MARYDGPSGRANNRGEPYRIAKPAKLKVKNSNGPNNWKDSKNSAGKVKSANAAISPLKRRLRDLNRLLSKNANLPADIKIAHEREIQALQHELVSLLLDKERHEMIGKYHMVRFFERQKATRRYKGATRALEGCEDHNERQELQKQVHIAQVDLNYTHYYPHMGVYQSLWTKEKGENGEVRYIENNKEADGAKGNVSLWRQVERATEEGTLEKLRDAVDDDKMESIRKSISSIGIVTNAGGKAKGEDADSKQENETGLGFFE
jgi:hypothetical protein